MGWLALLALIPIILHWLMRPRPKQLLFPALRLIQLRKKQNTRRLKLRHLTLLLLRVGVILGIVFTLARPRVPSAGYLPTPGEWGIFVGIIVAAFILYALLARYRSPANLSFAEQTRRGRRRIFGIGGVAALLIFIFVLWPLQARIRSDSNNPAPTLNANIPVAAAFVFDTSLSMEYQQQGKTRLDVAREIAVNYLQTLPRNSSIALTDTSTLTPLRFSNDLSTTITRIGRLETHTVSQTLDEKLLATIEAHLAEINRITAAGSTPANTPTDDYIREIYLFTDLSRGAWSETRIQNLADKLQASPQIGLYLIDVSSETITNTSLNNLKLSDSLVPVGSEVRLSLTLNSTSSAPEERQVELFLQSADPPGELIKQEQLSLQTSASAPATAQFLLKNIQGRIRQGEIRLTSSDPLHFDDVQSFSLETLPPVKMLVVSDVKNDAQFWIAALSPQEFQRQGRTSVRCDWVSPQLFSEKTLDEYSAIAFINVREIPERNWNMLEAFVERGGGLALILGKEVDAVSYFEPPAALKLLPAQLFGHASFDPPEFFDLEPGLNHPLLKKFSELQITTLNDTEVKRYWRVEPQEGANTLIRFSDDRLSPALVERSYGKGRVLLFATGVSRQGWNELPVSGWQWVVLADQMARYLAQRTFVNLNYTAGESVLTSLPDDVAERNFLLRKPGGQQVPYDAPAEQSTLLINDLDQLGSYRLLSAARDSRFERGFSVNYAPRESDLTRIETQDLTQRLGKERYRVVRSLADLDRTVRTGRIGVEALPEFFLLLILFFVGELLLSNLFYREDQQPLETPVRTPKAA